MLLASPIFARAIQEIIPIPGTLFRLPLLLTTFPTPHTWQEVESPSSTGEVGSSCRLLHEQAVEARAWIPGQSACEIPPLLAVLSSEPQVIGISDTGRFTIPIELPTSPSPQILHVSGTTIALTDPSSAGTVGAIEGKSDGLEEKSSHTPGAQTVAKTRS